MDLFPGNFNLENKVSEVVTQYVPGNVWLYLVAVLFIVAFFAFYYFRPKATEVVNMGPFELKGALPSSKETIFEQSQINTNLGNNFTLSFFVYMDDVNRERIPIAGPKGDFRFKVFLHILGVGEIILDPIHQMARFQLKVLHPKTQKVVNIDIENVMIARWNQITLTIEGRSVDIYINGRLATSTLLENLPVLHPVGVLMETSPDFSGQAGLFQAWSYRLTESAVWKNYKRNTDTRGKPLIPDKKPDIFGELYTNFTSSLCDVGFCGFRFQTGPLEYVDYEFA